MIFRRLLIERRTSFQIPNAREVEAMSQVVIFRLACVSGGRRAIFSRGVAGGAQAEGDHRIDGFQALTCGMSGIPGDGESR